MKVYGNLWTQSLFLLEFDGIKQVIRWLEACVKKKGIQSVLGT